MTTATFANAEALARAETQGDRRPLPSFGARLWDALTRAGERRAAVDIARLVRLRGHKPSGDLQRDLQRLTDRGVR